MKNLITPICMLFSIWAYAQVPMQVKDILPGAASSLTGGFDVGIAAYNNKLFFVADGGEGFELWTSDGTQAGTVLLKDINPTAGASSYCENFYVVNNLLLFTADNGVNGVELWKTDGTPEGTTMVKDIRPGLSSGVAFSTVNARPDFYVWNEVLYFNGNDGVNGEDLWRSDGTEAGTFMVKNINTTPGAASTSEPRHYGSHNGKLYFSASSIGEGSELWVTDGTAGGTMLVKSIQSGVFSSNPSNLVSCNGYLIFTASASFGNEELWRSDGTAAGTMLVKEIHPSTGGLVTSPNSYEKRLIKIGDVVYFSAKDGTHGTELWRSDGTEAGTYMVKDASTDPSGYAPQNFAVANDILYYKYDDAIHGQELWRSDGTETGTYMVKDIEPGFFGAFYLPTHIYAHNGTVYFNAINSGSIWKSNGTESGTVSVSSGTPGTLFSSPFQFFGFGDFLFFGAYTPSAGEELWKYYTLQVLPLVTSIESNNNINCFGEATGALSVFVSGGLEPYTFEWSQATAEGQNPTGLPAGNYTVVVTDALGTNASSSFEITQPAPLMAATSSTPATNSNADGSAQVTVSGGTPAYTYLWNTNPPLTTANISNVPAGTYEVMITDANNCSLSTSVTISMSTAVSEAFSKALKVAPSLSSDGQFRLLSEIPLSDLQITLVNSQGQVVQKWNNASSGQLFTIDHPTSGFYFIQITHEAEQAVKRLVLKR